MSKRFRTPPSVDVYLEEIPADEKHRVRFIGTIVSISPTSLIVNDGTAQVNLALGVLTQEQFEVQQLGRFIADIQNTDGELQGVLLAWNKVTADQAKRYRRIIKLERRITK